MLVKGPCWGRRRQSISPHARTQCACVRARQQPVITSLWQRRLAARPRKHSRATMSFTSSSVLHFLSEPLIFFILFLVRERESDSKHTKKQLNFNVFLLPNPAAFSGSALPSRCGRRGDGGGEEASLIGQSQRGGRRISQSAIKPSC